MYESNDYDPNFSQQQQPASYQPAVPGYSGYYGCPSYPIGADPWLTAQALQLGQQATVNAYQWANAEIENNRLRDCLAQKVAAEDAYTLVGSTSGKTVTTNRMGHIVEVMDAEVICVRHLAFLPPFAHEDLFVIDVSEGDEQIVLTSTQFQKDSALLQAFQELPGVHIRLCPSVKRTANLLRQAILQKSQFVEFPFYAGWNRDPERGFHFWKYTDGRTHRTELIPQSVLIGVPVMNAATQVAAAYRFQQQVKLDLSQHDQWLLWMLFHVAALYSLLGALGHPFPFALCVLTECAANQAWLKSWLSWFGDAPVSLSQPPQVFAEEIISRKDQPLVVLDDRGGNAATKNAALLDEVLTSRMAPWRDGRAQKYVPLQALPIILSSTASALATSPDCITLHLTSKLPALTDADEMTAVVKDYLDAFIQYVQGHVDQLRELLDIALRATFQCSEGLDMSENCIVARGQLSGLQLFLYHFLRFCGLPISSKEENASERDSWLLDLLGQTSEKMLDCGDLAAQFIDVAGSQLRSGKLCPCPVEYEKEPDGPAVFYSEDHLFFTGPAMRAISESLGQSQPVVIRALSEAGLLMGKPINAGTRQTRISVWSVYGRQQTKRGYKLPRTAFDALGDPLVFEGEDSE